MNNEKLLILDGSNLLFQMFYGMPSRISDINGKPIHAVLGFTGALIKILKSVSPDKVIAVFDGEHENERNILDSDYKANRTDFTELPDEDTPFFQLPLVCKVLEYMGIKYFETTCCETDDIIASYTALLQKEYDIVISSFDSDFFQLISESVKILRYRGEKTVIYDETMFESKFSIKPSLYADFKSLTGDTSDNIRGVSGIGPKTAAMLVNTYGSIESIISSAHTMKSKRISDSIITNADTIRKNYKLIKLTGDQALPFGIDELDYIDKKSSTRHILEKCGIIY